MSKLETTPRAWPSPFSRTRTCATWSATMRSATVCRVSYGVTDDASPATASAAFVAPASAPRTTSRALIRRGAPGSTTTACTWWMHISVATSVSAAHGGHATSPGAITSPASKAASAGLRAIVFMVPFYARTVTGASAQCRRFSRVSTDDRRVARWLRGGVTVYALRAPDARPVAAAPALALLQRRMAFVTGKGGVGKTTVAAALGLAAAAGRRPTVVCELAAQAQLARTFGRTPPRPGTEVDLAPRLASISIDPDAALEEWLATNIGRPGAALLGRSDAFRYFVAAAPGAREIVGMARRGT